MINKSVCMGVGVAVLATTTMAVLVKTYQFLNTANKAMKKLDKATGLLTGEPSSETETKQNG